MKKYNCKISTVKQIIKNNNNRLKRRVYLGIITAVFSLGIVCSNKVFASDTIEREATQQETTFANKETNVVETTNQEQTTTTSETTASQETTVKESYTKSKLSPVKSKIILLDPGHCKVHTGAHANGLKEEVITLDIGFACRDYLNNFGDVTVYMTRTNGNCLSPASLAGCLVARNNMAKRLDADFLVSLHINADDSTSKKGALLLAAYNSGYRNSVGIKTRDLGKIILNNLQLTGMYNGGFLLRKASYEKYPNKAKADYYSIVREGIYNKIPSIIVEHGFITNKNECKKFLKTTAKRKKLGEADGKGIAAYYNLNKKNILGTLKKKGKSQYYIDSNGKKTTGWVKINGNWYHFNSNNGKMNKGFITVGKNKFYLNSKTGVLKTGWFKVKNKMYLAKGNGVILKNIIYNDGINSYYFNSKGYKKSGWVTYKDATYYFSKKKGMLKGKQKIKKKYYKFSKKTGKLLSKI